MNWPQLVNEHGPMVHRLAWRILGHATDAEDIVQEVFLEASRTTLNKDVHNWPGLLHRLTVCRAIDHLRKRTSQDELMKSSKPLVEISGPIEQLVADELAAQLRAALKQLPPREAQVFCLRCFENLTTDEVARTLSLSHSSVSVTLHRARTHLQSLLQESVIGEKHETYTQ